MLADMDRALERHMRSAPSCLLPAVKPWGAGAPAQVRRSARTSTPAASPPTPPAAELTPRSREIARDRASSTGAPKRGRAPRPPRLGARAETAAEPKLAANGPRSRAGQPAPRRPVWGDSGLCRPQGTPWASGKKVSGSAPAARGPPCASVGLPGGASAPPRAAILPTLPPTDLHSGACAPTAAPLCGAAGQTSKNAPHRGSEAAAPPVPGRGRPTRRRPRRATACATAPN